MADDPDLSLQQLQHVLKQQGLTMDDFVRNYPLNLGSALVKVQQQLINNNYEGELLELDLGNYSQAGSKSLDNMTINEYIRSLLTTGYQQVEQLTGQSQQQQLSSSLSSSTTSSTSTSADEQQSLQRIANGIESALSLPNFTDDQLPSIAQSIRQLKKQLMIITNNNQKQANVRQLDDLLQSFADACKNELIMKDLTNEQRKLEGLKMIAASDYHHVRIS